jgi:hypothetical protein
MHELIGILASCGVLATTVVLKSHWFKDIGQETFYTYTDALYDR